MWWMDLEPYPGPYEAKDLFQTFHEMATVWGRAIGKPAADMAKMLQELGNAYHISIEHSDPGPTRLPVFKLPAPTPIPTHGPRRGSAYDRRGRRRW